MEQSCFFDWRVIMHITKKLLHTLVDVVELSNEFVLRVDERFEVMRHLEEAATRLSGEAVNPLVVDEVVRFVEREQRRLFYTLYAGLHAAVDSDQALFQVLKDAAMGFARMSVDAEQLRDNTKYELSLTHEHVAN
jgi:hypothetical protein